MQSEEGLATHHVDPAENINYPVMPDTGIKYVEQSIIADIDELMDMYEYAEKLYPYSNLRLRFDRNPHAARRQDLVLDLMVNNKPKVQFGWFFLGMASFAFQNKKPVLNSLTYSKHPVGACAWGLAFFFIMYGLRNGYYRVNDIRVKKNLLANRNLHGYLKTLKRHILARNELPTESYA